MPTTILPTFDSSQNPDTNQAVIEAIEKVKQFDPVAYDRIKGIFTTQKQAIK